MNSLSFAQTITALFTAMLAVLVTWVIAGMGVIGLGLLVRRALGNRRALDGAEVLVSFWLGFAALLAVLQVWNFFAPVNALSAGLLLGLGGVGILAHLKTLAQWSARVARTERVAILVLGVMAIWLANRTIGPGNASDSGLYHFSAILWAKTYAVVPGLGNLSVPLALNNASFLYTAMLDHGYWSGRSEHIANGMLLLAMIAQVIRAAFMVRQRRGWLPESLYFLALAPAVFMNGLAKDISSPKTDLPAGLLTVIAGAWLLRFVFHPDRLERAGDRVKSMAALCAAAACVKLSVLAYAGCAGLIVIALWWKRRELTTLQRWRITAAGAVIVALLLGPWMGRSVILSGYPVFPSRVMPIDVPWRVEDSAVNIIVDGVRRQSQGGLTLWLHHVATENRLLRWYAPLIKPPFEKSEDIKGFNWVRSWIFCLPLSSPNEILLPLALALIGCVVIISRLHALRSCGIPPPRLLLIALPGVAGLILWMIGGPDPRYGWPSAWTLGASLFALAFVPAFSDGGSQTARRFFVGVIVVALLPVLTYRMAVHALLDRDTSVRDVLFYGPGEDDGFHPRPRQTMTSIVNRWGLKIYVPGEEFPYHCYNGPLPCSGWPELDPDLRERRAGDLSAGFVIDRSPSDS